ncbi:MAG: sugar kinase [Micromonosporaceae bacterium]
MTGAAGGLVTGGGSMGAGGLVTLGETMAVLTAPEPGPLAHARCLRLGVAGSESNVAIGVRRLGHPATWIGRVGRDAVGELVLRELRAEGVTCLVTEDDAPTGLMVKHRRTADRTRVDYHRAGSAGARLCPQDVPSGVVAGAAVLHLTGITPALGPGPADAVRHAIQVARDAGVTVSLDVNYRAALWREEQARGVLEELLDQVDVMFAGVTEARLLVNGDTPAELASQLARRGPRQVVVTLGAAGAYALVDGEPYDTPAIEVPVVDPVGAGDAFVAGYLAELISGAPPRRRLAIGTAAAGFVVATAGDWEGLPRRADLPLLTSADDVLR